MQGEGSKEMRLVGLLVLGLLFLLILVGVTFIVSGKFQESICTTEDSDYVWNDGECQASATNSTAVTITALTQVGKVVTGITTVLGFLAVIVIVLIASIVLRVAKKMA